MSYSGIILIYCPPQDLVNDNYYIPDVMMCYVVPLSNNLTTESSSQNRVKFTPAEDKLVIIITFFNC